MSDNAYTYGLNYNLIQKAVHGEKDALEEILQIYKPFHNALVTREVLGPDGKFYKAIDEDKKIQVQMHFFEVIRTKVCQMIYENPKPGRPALLEP